jgi:hypothetical protein
MTAPGDDDTRAEAPARKYKWRYGPVRLVGPWVAVLVGLIAVITHANGLNKSGSENTGLLFYIGLGLIALGVIMFFVYRWMAKRGI